MLRGLLVLLFGVFLAQSSPGAESPLSGTNRSPLRLVSRLVSTNKAAGYGAVYAEPKSSRMLTQTSVSEDNGRTWVPFKWKPDFEAGLPYGYRREPVTAVCDPRAGRLMMLFNALDTPGLDPKAVEPPIAQQTYYLRYRVSADGGRTWLFDEPLIQRGAFDAKHPLQGVWIGTNAIYLGDMGCVPIVTRGGKILVPAQMTPLGPDGTLWNPTGGYTFTDVVVLSGSWTSRGRLEWGVSPPVRADPARTTRGMIEPTLAEFPTRILMVMRGSNGGRADRQHRLPSYKWFSISTDDGQTWSKPEPWTYEDGTPFFSPSSMSVLLRHSSGRCFWAGNLSPVNCQGNLPRWPLVLGEVDPQSLRLIRPTVIEVDTEQAADKTRGRLDLSHMTLIEDRQTRELVLVYPRAHNAYKSYEWATARFALSGR